jgi:hypothetical protein
VFDALLIVLSHPPGKGILPNDLADVFEDEIIRSQISVCAEAVALLLCLKDRDRGILFVLEALVLAIGSALAVIDTFDLSCAINAVGVLTTSMVDLCSSICAND